MKFIQTIVILSISLTSIAQSKKLSLSINYGVGGNFFVRSYDEQNGPANKTYFYKKKFIGTIGGVAINYKLKKSAGLFFEYSRLISHSSKSRF